MTSTALRLGFLFGSERGSIGDGRSSVLLRTLAKPLIPGTPLLLLILLLLGICLLQGWVLGGLRPTGLGRLLFALQNWRRQLIQSGRVDCFLV